MSGEERGWWRGWWRERWEEGGQRGRWWEERGREPKKKEGRRRRPFAALVGQACSKRLSARDFQRENHPPRSRGRRKVDRPRQIPGDPFLANSCTSWIQLAHAFGFWFWGGTFIRSLMNASESAWTCMIMHEGRCTGYGYYYCSRLLISEKFQQSHSIAMVKGVPCTSPH